MKREIFQSSECECIKASWTERMACGVVQVQLPPEISAFIQESTGNYGKVKLVLHRNKFWVESPYPDILRTLLKVLLSPCRFYSCPEGADFHPACESTQLNVACLFLGIGHPKLI